MVLSGNTYRLVAESVLTALEARFLEAGRPRRLQVVYPIMAERARAGSGGQGTGVNRLAKPDLMRRVVAGSFSRDADKELNQLVTRDAVEAYNLPMGTIFAWIRATAAGKPGPRDAGRHRHVRRSSAAGRPHERGDAGRRSPSS